MPYAVGTCPYCTAQVAIDCGLSHLLFEPDDAPCEHIVWADVFAVGPGIDSVASFEHSLLRMAELDLYECLCGLLNGKVQKSELEGDWTGAEFWRAVPSSEDGVLRGWMLFAKSPEQIHRGAAPSESARSTLPTSRSAALRERLSRGRTRERG